MLVSDTERLWTASAGLLRQQVSESTWMSCFDGIQAIEDSGGSDSQVTLSVSNPIVRERIESRWMNLLTDALSEAAGKEVSVKLEVHTNPHEFVSTRSQTVSHGVSANSYASQSGPNRQMNDKTGPTRQTDARDTSPNAPKNDDAPVNFRYTFDAFVIGGSNRFAHAAALSVAENPAKAYNPLFIHGGSGLGKTHLLHAIGNYVREQFPSRKVQYVSTETFVNEFIDAIRNNSTTSFKRRYRDCDVLLIDDIQLLEGKETTQEEFFHTFNSLYGAQKQIVITSDRPPKSIATLEDRLRSRFLSGLITDVQPPELETRLAILRKKAEGERAQVPDEVLEFIATHVKQNIRELEGALIRVSAFASLNRMQITVELAEKVLADILATDRPRQITPQVILDATSKMFGFTIDEICGTSRRRPLVNARQTAMYVFRELTDYSYPAIAREFGGRDHTTVIHAVEKITGLMKEQRRVYDQVIELIQTIKAAA